MQVKHIYWFAYFNMFSPSVRYRGKYPLDHLNEKHGVTFSFVFPSYHPINILHFIYIYFSVLFFRKNDSLIVIQRVYTNFIYSLALKFLLLIHKRNTLYDLDDAEYFDHPFSEIDSFLKKCESCSVGSIAVKKYVEKFNPNAFLLTSPVLAHSITKKEKSSVFTIGWIGDFGGSHRESLYTIFFPAIKNIEFPIKFIILGVRQEKHRKELNEYFIKNNNISVSIPEDIDWENELSVYNRVNEFDIGICPLIDNEITRAKSAFKIKQYFSCGIPALGSNVGENAMFIKNNINGYLCNTPEDYKTYIEKVKNMKSEEYSELSYYAKQSVSEFDMENYCSALLKHYASMG